MDALWRRAIRAAVDHAWRPLLKDGHELTLLFEETIFTILPTALLIFLTPIYLLHYNTRPVIAGQSRVLWTELSTAGFAFVLQLVAAVFYIPPAGSTPPSVAASVLPCLAVMAIACLLYSEHRRAVQSSALISLYLSVTLVLDILKTRSYLIREEMHRVGYLYVAIAAAKLALLVLEEVPRRYRGTNAASGSETTRGFWNRTFFVWLNSTLLLGFRKVLSVNSLPNLESNFSSRKLAQGFEQSWARSKLSSLRLLRTTLWSVIWSFLAVVPARLLYIGFMFTHPFLLQYILEYAGSSERSQFELDELLGATAFVHVGTALSRVWYTHMNNRLNTKVRGILISQILRKNLSLTREEAMNSASVTLMSTDVDGIARNLPKVHEAWASLVELGLGIYLLYTILRKASALVVAPVIISMLISIEIGRRSHSAFGAWNAATQDRVSKTGKFLSQLKGVKMLASEDAVAEYIQRLREAEIAVSKRGRVLTVWTHVSAPIGFTFTPILVIAGGLFWTRLGDFDAAVAFTSLAFISLASKPIMTILVSWSRLGTLIACFDRIEKYLLLRERRDHRWESSGYDLASKRTLPLLNIDQFPIQLMDASIAPAAGKPPLLRANISLLRTSISMLIGPTASGKSVLLKALIGEASVVEGSTYVRHGVIAYCHQESWICNLSIRANIIGKLPYDESWYNKVIGVCLLVREISEFTLGDLSLAGSRGCNLSGGQKQRLALARALYSRASILVLDNVLSAVDRSTAEAILTRLIGPNGLLRTLGVTVVMTTRSTEDLNFADKVLAIDRSGYVTTELPKAALRKYAAAEFLDEENDDSISDGGRYGESAARYYAPPQPTSDEANTRLRQQGDTTLYKYYLKSVSVWVLCAWLLMTIVVAVTEKMPDVFVRIWMEQDPSNNTYFTGYAMIGVGYLISAAIWTWTFFLHLVPESSERLHRLLLDSVFKATLSFLTYTDEGAILNRFSQDMSLISQDLPLAFMFFLYTLFGVITDIVLTVSASPYSSILFPFIVVLLLILQYYYLRTSRQMRLLDLEAKTPLYTHFTETSEGIEHIRAFGWEEETLSKGLELLDYSQKPVYHMYCIQRWLGLVLDLTVAGVAVAIVGAGLERESANQPALGLALLYAMKLGPQMTSLIDEWVELETSLGALARLRAFALETPMEISGPDSSRADLADVPHVPDNWPPHGNVEFNEVSSNYDLANGGRRPALHNVSVEILGGAKIGILGHSGSGKTSLFLTLLNFLEYTGSIIIDGIEISSIPRSVLRSRIICISQDLINLPSSVRDNLTPREICKDAADRVSDESIYQALTKVGLEQRIRSRGGLDGLLEDLALSHGQRQLLALARALIQMAKTNSKLVLVDEATSSVDVECEDRMKAVMDEAFAECTVLTIAHRLRTMDAADVLLEMSHGRLTQENPEGELPM